MNRLFILLFAICFSASSYGQNAATLRKAKAGDAKSQYSIALTYKYGWDGAPKDDEKYVYWLKKAANGGVAEAQYYLGELYKVVNTVYLKTKAYILNGLKKQHSTDRFLHAYLLVFIMMI